MIIIEKLKVLKRGDSQFARRKKIDQIEEVD